MKAKVLSAGVVPVFLADEPEVLLLRSFRYWDFPKGVVETGEDPMQAALRELQEETGLSKVRWTWGYGFIETPPYAGGKIARYYLAQVSTRDVSLVANPESGILEHQEFRWLGFSEAEKLLVPRVRDVLAWAKSKIK
jgi:bis(5'-nucleosidyl)-tetraphosphatase